jgi:hypothetical protein
MPSRPAASRMTRSGPRGGWQFALQQTLGRLFDHLVSAQQERFWDGQPKRLRGLEIDHQLELRWRLHRQVGGFLALEYAVDTGRRAPKIIGLVRSVGQICCWPRPGRK